MSISCSLSTFCDFIMMCGTGQNFSKLSGNFSSWMEFRIFRENALKRTSRLLRRFLFNVWSYLQFFINTFLAKLLGTMAPNETRLAFLGFLFSHRYIIPPRLLTSSILFRKQWRLKRRFQFLIDYPRVLKCLSSAENSKILTDPRFVFKSLYRSFWPFIDLINT